MYTFKEVQKAFELSERTLRYFIEESRKSENGSIGTKRRGQLEFSEVDAMHIALCDSASRSGLPITPSFIEKLGRTVIKLPDDDDIIVMGERPATVILEVGRLWKEALQKLAA